MLKSTYIPRLSPIPEGSHENMAKKAFLGWPVFDRPRSLDLGLALAIEGARHWLCATGCVPILGPCPHERRHPLMFQVLAYVGAALVIVLFLIGFGAAAVWTVVELLFVETPPVEPKHHD